MTYKFGGFRSPVAYFYCNNKKTSGQWVRRTAEKQGESKGLASFSLMVAEASEEKKLNNQSFFFTNHHAESNWLTTESINELFRA